MTALRGIQIKAFPFMMGRPLLFSINHTPQLIPFSHGSLLLSNCHLNYHFSLLPGFDMDANPQLCLKASDEKVSLS